MSWWPKFAIFYADGTVVEGGGMHEQTVEITLRVPKTWIDAPADGVQSVVVEDPYVCRYVWRGKDFYYWVPDGEVCATDSIGEFMRGYVPLVKHGLCVPAEKLEEIYYRVKHYERIPRTCDNRRPLPDADL